MPTGMNEVSRKIELVREQLRTGTATALRLRGVDWFAWATGGGDSSVIFSNEVGVAEVLITRTRAYVLTSAIEQERLAVEELPTDYELVGLPWAEPTAIDDFVRREGGSAIWSDRPQISHESLLPPEILALKLQLSYQEVARYRALGLDAGRAATAALAQVEPNHSEWELAGLAAKELWSRGIHPMLTLVAGEGRVSRHRHPVATNARLGDHAMLVICGRRDGLYANFTRHVFFRPPREEELQRARDVALVEAVAFSATQELQPLPEIYGRMKSKYEELGYPQEIYRHHQGGPCGYLSRETIAGPGETFPWRPVIHSAFAWNPSLPGAKIEDTIYLGEDRALHFITCDPEWPAIEVEGRRRPDLWVR